MAKAQILIVEDDRVVALDIENRLKNLGYSVPAKVAYGEEAIQKIDEHNPDIVLMDIVLKGKMDGIEAAEIIRSRFGTPAENQKPNGRKETVPQLRVSTHT